MLLAVDTSTAQVGLALLDGTQVVGELVWTSRHHHSAELAPGLAGLLERCTVSIDSIQALGVALGPGSFTSLRIGLAFVKGLALARRIPLVGIPTLDVTAASQLLGDLPLAAVLQAGRGRLAVAHYLASDGCWAAQGAAQVMTAAELAGSICERTLVCGELSDGDRQALAACPQAEVTSPAQGVRRPAVLAELARERWQAGGGDDPAAIAPIYLHVVPGSVPDVGV
jgi:tRNA threonylcarbamoyladenosine biosynthesis protein TsaB